MKHIALFGGSFNPPHVGHRKVVEFLAKNPQFDKVWVLPTFSHPFDKSLIDFSHRLKMCELNFGDLGKKVKICDIEGKFKKNPSYMIDTIKALQKKYPDIHFTIVVGSDCRNELSQWKNFDELRKETDFFFIPRAGFEKSPFTDISSTEIRKALKFGEAIGEHLVSTVKKYIEENKLYR